MQGSREQKCPIKTQNRLQQAGQVERIERCCTINVPPLSSTATPQEIKYQLTNRETKVERVQQLGKVEFILQSRDKSLTRESVAVLMKPDRQLSVLTADVENRAQPRCRRGDPKCPIKDKIGGINVQRPM